ncbi:porin family protein [Shewanella psychropiezotolerans]|uniref:Porin family protein n=1 Tax=Shewanella psychropiezotolerans TaxID=2593655 RepID=A0ABX5X3Y6_9GAMM|nr:MULTISPECIES: outer membrane beta-barrel protein [Shewanella]MPY25578.1 porin family protein [Shewanella sp. YLB-07]QDO86065.1 porin family protein [Shewanella psychropiezotolerans]
MKTKSLALAAVIATAMSAPTMAADWFIGGAVGYQQDTYKTDSLLEGKDKDKQKDMTYQVRGGAYLNDNNRVYGTYSYNSDDIAKQQGFLMSYDYLIGLDASNKLNWFVGATAGMNHTSPDSKDFSSKNTFVWGGQTGFMYKINDKLSTEIGYRYLKQDYDLDISNGANKGTFSLNDTQQVYLGVDYRF